MRVLRVAQKLYPDVLGGAPYHVHAMSRDQAAMGHDVTVLTVRFDESLPHVERRDGYTIVRYDAVGSPFGNDLSLGVAQYLSTAEFDVIHAHSHLYFSTNMAALKRRLGDTPLALTSHGLFSQTAPRRAQEIYLETLGKWTFNRADRVFCYTDGVRERLRARGITAPIDVISNGIDPTRFRPDGPTSDRIDTSRPVVLSVIRLVDGKRPMETIDAVRELRETVPDAHLYIAGDGYLREDLTEYLATEGLEDAVTLLGSVPYDEMPALYRACDVLLLASEEEAGAPRVVLEAMATEKPFVMTEMDQTTDLLTNVGFTAPVGDVEGLAAALNAVLTDPTRRRNAGTEGRGLVESEFNWRKTVEETTRSLEELVRQSATHD